MDRITELVITTSIPATMVRLECGACEIVNAVKAAGEFIACDECGTACEIVDTVPTFIASLA